MALTSTKPRPKSAGLFEPIDIRAFIEGDLFRETPFRAALRQEDWSRFSGKRVLVKGCGKGPAIPPWAWMLLLAHLTPVAAAVLYGEDCDPIVVWKRSP
ncbi:MAG: DUF2480 family protein [Calditrichaeota bacterium]|nr:DUF2480 family protein [Calditrichota bacterium]